MSLNRVCQVLGCKPVTECLSPDDVHVGQRQRGGGAGLGGYSSPSAEHCTRGCQDAHHNNNDPCPVSHES